MSGFSAAANAAAAERCALAFRARPAASSPAKRQQQPQPASLRRSGGQRRPTTLSASSRGPVVPRAVATSADRASPDLIGKFTLDSNSELQVAVNPAPQGLVSEISLEVTNTSGSLILHWGALRPDKRDWILPSRKPDGTTVYKNRALRTPFVKSGDNSTLRIEIDDPGVHAIEFLIFDETQNKWFKNNGQNFQVQFQSSRHQGTGASGASSSATSTLVPEDLVQIQAYLRWERRGKQSYTPEQEKEEYEAARAELIEEVNRGVSLEKLRAKLTKAPEAPESDESKSSASRMPIGKLPEDLVQVQAYIRWEQAGKPNYPPEKQLVEFEEARKELQAEVDKGISIDQLRQKILKGNIESKVSKQLKNKKYFSVERIQRKKRDITQLLSKHKHTLVEDKVEVVPKQPTVLDLFTKSLHEKDGCEVLSRKLFKFGDKEILAISTKVQNKTEVHLATNHTDPLILHWSLAKNAGEWKAPSPNILPSGSTLLDKACETEFTKSELDGLHYQVVEIELDDGGYKGMPFVLRSGETWIKNNGSDFFLDFSTHDVRNIKLKGNGDAGKGTAKALLERIADLEEDAQRSLMHRFNIAADLADQARDAGLLGIVGLFVWIRFMATRQLTWNKNYNVKPREISKAQDRFTDDLENMYKAYPQYREILRMIMAAVGRGGEGDVGQRIRDEILVIQRNNDCKGGMMEEWHQKLHNNTSPDDVVICQALIDYIKSDFDISVYWDTLNKNGITKERLLSYDRAIHSEPNFRSEQKAGLLRDLGNYMRSLKAVHSGADLESAIASCMGYKSEGEGFMVGVQINPVKGLPSGFPELLEFVLEHVEDKSAEPLLEGLLEARVELRPLLLDSRERMKDLIFLDIALDSTFRTAIERSYEELNDAAPEKIMYFISLVLENLALSIDDNEDILYCLKGWNQALEMAKQKDDQWALYAKAFLDRNRLALASKGEQYHNMMQPSAEYLGSLLSIDQWAVNIFTEEIIRGGSAATLSALLNRFDPVLRNVAHLGSWQVISPVEVSGYVVVVDELLAVQNKSYDKPTILVAKSVKGEEEIPDGVVGVITPDMPDVLSHVSVRARNSKVLFATCFDHTTLSELEGYDQKLFSFKPTSADITYREITESELQQSSSPNAEVGHAVPSISLAKKKFLGKYAISAEEFSEEMVGAKSRNIAYLKGKVPSWVGVPTSVAIPFGTFEKVLSDGLNKEVAQSIEKLKIRLAQEDFSALGEIRKVVLNLTAPMQLVNELKERMLGSGMPWPGDEGDKRWEQAWMAIKKVWASKWNERAYFSTRKVKLDHEYLSMAVLVQEVVNADYAFVIHTTNPSSGDSSEIYAEVVKGLGETLVGAYPGRAMSFVCKKDDLDSPKLLGYPSKPIGLFIRQSIIFRSDSNGEDLEGYAGAGLYDSVPMDEEDEVVLDYTTDPLIVDRGFRSSILSSIARAGHAIEELYGSPQDVEGVVKDGKIYVVQTRPQM
ncbi:alpha-glucan water dikinase 1 chloroplastic isoform X1 [Zea mays]|uniref:Alpha-glucan water dikinase 1 chloroplastic n=5 Tax=Zea mays TaxID=4577 RepID=A0A1D6LTL9_MAIZE|nr:Alpha-glucan water dikinase 1 chloroplastic [Zea mays]XP_020394628.1 alpha-glucan water dikinase 1 chloroplastic isoform X1 [Zea mays]AQK82749.1 Alpha-glucan water dikinase 1 chloroplastic [Zea mays]AQK82752.1 Alpha-glucan water dikinase 1 chloroplastic [Zea mays]AQK82756.1 Alpha-glucan water dikinase 1 chloroplastic [Zea mays]AQK82757.1 Alpha-glucan water dikinase 1 chloroplastic [Zea mays]|eukprot:XP_008648013.1 alpha-glucan water dikinase 1 chloroplastic isoform X1 [Zea mays]